ncbi:MAG: subclass B3 metallo-beta-lactamase [Pyrinomonadaceae bacterium]
MKLKALVILLLLATVGMSQISEQDREWNAPVEPFRIIGNVYYVGAAEVTSFLVTTPKGHFLIDSGYAETVPQIRANVERLGFKFDDIKVLLNTQAHYDHAGGFAEIRKLTKAKMIAGVRDKIGLESGGRNDFTWGDKFPFPPVAVDKIVVNNDRATLGGVTLTAVATPGHTRGCTMWILDTKEKGRNYRVAFVGSTTTPGYTLVDNQKYPTIVADFKHTFSVMGKLRPDVFLASHGSFFGLSEKAEQLRKGVVRNPFIDRKAYRVFVRDTRKAFLEKLAIEKRDKAKTPAPRPRIANVLIP